MFTGSDMPLGNLGQHLFALGGHVIIRQSSCDGFQNYAAIVGIHQQGLPDRQTKHTDIDIAFGCAVQGKSSRHYEQHGSR